MLFSDVDLNQLQKPIFLNENEANSWTAAVQSLTEVQDYLKKVI